MSNTPETYVETPVYLKDIAPETDAALVDHMPADDNEWSQCYLDLSRLCRKLEQERDEVVEALKELCKLYEDFRENCDSTYENAYFKFYKYAHDQWTKAFKVLEKKS